MHNYEIEIKSLLGSKDQADALVKKMRQKDPNLKILGSHKQLNHYFAPVPFGTGQVSGNLNSLLNKVKHLLPDEKRASLFSIIDKAKPRSDSATDESATGDFSVRTRWADGSVILVVKATIDDTTSSNGTARLEWESKVPITLEELDKLVLHSGFEYQAKWSRERNDYKYHPLPGADVSVSIDKNAGYGHLAEFEMVVDDKDKADDAKNLIRTVMGSLEVDELPQDRLKRMFDFYNKNWKDYYGTEKTFNIE